MAVDIHFCRSDEIDDLMSFIGAHWARGHILSVDRALMDWQHENRDRDGYCYVLARAGDDNRILGVLGYISTRRYDPELAGENTLWVALWKVRDDCNVAGLGIMILRYVVAHEPHRSIGIVGVGNAAHFGLYNALGYATGHFDQHFMLNPDLSTFELAVVPGGSASAVPPRGTATLTRLESEDIRDFEARHGRLPDRRAVPLKTPAYFLNRFLRHPVYDYGVYLARMGERALGLIAVRLCVHHGAKALRIVDWYGDDAKIGELGTAVAALLRETGAEYADVWSAGLGRDELAGGGFRLVARDAGIVIPTFFEPFVRENGELMYAFKSQEQRPFVLFKADGDQDRPNTVAAPRQRGATVGGSQ